MTADHLDERATELRTVCLHECAHEAIARHHGIVDGWVDVSPLEPGSITPPGVNFYNGHFWHDPIKSRRTRRLVGWAGVLAELLSENPNIDANDAVDRIRCGSVVLSDSDAEMMGGRQDLASAAECLSMLRHLWPSIIEATAQKVQLVQTIERERRPRPN